LGTESVNGRGDEIAAGMASPRKAVAMRRIPPCVLHTLPPHVYQLLLTRRYLTTKIMPLLAAVAVALCTAMELIVWSVMGGFLTMLVESGRSLIGDVAISWPTSGFPYYEDLIEKLEADPRVAAAAPVIESFGLLRMPPEGRIEPVTIKGVEGESYDKVTEYDGAIWWRPIGRPMPKDKHGEDLRAHPENRESLKEYERAGRTLTMPDGKPGIVIGVEVTGFNQRNPGGWIEPWVDVLGDELTLSVLPMGVAGRPYDVDARRFPVANEFRSGLYEVDANTVLVRLDALQDMLQMDEAKRLEETGKGAFRVEVDEQGNEGFVNERIVGIEPARVTNVLVRAKEGVTAEQLRDVCHEVYDAFEADHPDAVPGTGSILIRTWKDRNRTLIAAVEKEMALVMFIFGVISLTSVFLVLAIFWSMISEKTKDIGVLRAIGASRGGIAGLWLAYGFGIGAVGSAIGGVLAYTIVANINPIHEWLGRAFGLTIWDPAVYYFTVIPNDLTVGKVAIILSGGVAASVLGALIPALRAAWLDPVKALRFE